MHVYGNDGRASIIVQTHSTMESQLPPWTIISYVRFITPIAFSTPRDLLLVFFFFFSSMVSRGFIFIRRGNVK